MASIVKRGNNLQAEHPAHFTHRHTLFLGGALFLFHLVPPFPNLAASAGCHIAKLISLTI